nr:ryanodine receptor-like isoform X2 [Dermacentor andersoni]
MRSLAHACLCVYQFFLRNSAILCFLFIQVVLPLMEKVFLAHRSFILMSPTATSTVGRRRWSQDLSFGRNHWLKNNVKEAKQVYTCVADLFNSWNKSQYFRQEDANFISQHDIDNMALIMPSKGRGRASVKTVDAGQGHKKEKRKKRNGKRDKDKELAASLVVACLRRLLPVGLNLFAGWEQELVQHAKEKFLSVHQKYSETYDPEALSNVLGRDKSGSIFQ